MTTVAIIQARTGSTRLPGKVMRYLGGKTVIEHVYDRVVQTRGLDEVVIAMPDQPADDALAEHVSGFCDTILRGSEADVLGRYADTARAFPAKQYVRITSDCPLFDPDILAAMLDAFPETAADYMSNTLDPHLPRGLDAEVFKAAALFDAETNAKAQHEREHVTPYIYQNPQRFSVSSFRERSDDLSDLRWTLDTAEDWALIEAMHNLLDMPFAEARTDDFVTLYDSRPDLREINATIVQKALGE
jgi:spore coat polysaccharide biosynthesis protein SpsF